MAAFSPSEDRRGFAQHGYEPAPPPYASLLSTPATTATAPGDEAILSQALSFVHQLPLPPPPLPLPRPIAIPQTAHGRGQPFLRAYAPSLLAHAITQTDFLAFVDNLNRVSTGSPPLQVVDAAGGLLGMVPHHWAMLAGTGIQAAAKLGTAVASQSRTDAYMDEVNARLFGPRGLHACLASTGAVKAILGMPDAQPVLAPLTPQTMHMTALQRELLGVGPYNAVLDLDVPQPTAPATLLDRWSARQVAAQEQRSQKTAIKASQKAVGKEEKNRRRTEKKQAKKERKEEKKNQKRGRKAYRDGSSESESTDSDESERSRSRSRAGQDKESKTNKRSKEEKRADKVAWIVIGNL